MAELTNEQLADKNLVAGKLQEAITFKSSLSPLFKVASSPLLFLYNCNYYVSLHVRVFKNLYM